MYNTKSLVQKIRIRFARLTNGAYIIPANTGSPFLLWLAKWLDYPVHRSLSQKTEATINRQGLNFFGEVIFEQAYVAEPINPNKGRFRVLLWALFLIPVTVPHKIINAVLNTGAFILGSIELSLAHFLSVAKEKASAENRYSFKSVVRLGVAYLGFGLFGLTAKLGRLFLENFASPLKMWTTAGHYGHEHDIQAKPKKTNYALRALSVLSFIAPAAASAALFLAFIPKVFVSAVNTGVNLFKSLNPIAVVPAAVSMGGVGHKVGEKTQDSPPQHQKSFELTELPKLTSRQKEELAAVRKAMGMDVIEEKINAELKKARQKSLPKKPFFNRFRSPLRFFHPETSNTAYKSAVIGPVLNLFGRVFNWVKDKDAEILSELFTFRTAKNQARPWTTLLSEPATWKALGKLVFSTPGALIRVGATIIDFALDVVFSPVRTIKNMAQAIWKPTKFFDNIHRHYQVTQSDQEPIKAAAEEAGLLLKVTTLNTGLLRSLYWPSVGFFSGIPVFARNVWRKLSGKKMPAETTGVELDRLSTAELHKKYIQDHDGYSPPLNNLLPPEQRIDALIQLLINKAADSDVLCLQEVFDNLSYFGLGQDSQSAIIEGLKRYFPHIVYDIGYRTWPFASSGLMVLSKHRILDVDYHRFSNVHGEGVLANKGFVAVKIQKGNDFYTLYNTHTQAGAGFPPTRWMEPLISGKESSIGTGQLRDAEFALIDEHIHDWASTPPADAPQLKYAGVILAGDMNTGMNTYEKMAGISSGKSFPETKGRKPGQIKYPGQHNLFVNTLNNPRKALNVVDIQPHIGLEAHPEGFGSWTSEKQEENKKKRRAEQCEKAKALRVSNKEKLQAALADHPNAAVQTSTSLSDDTLYQTLFSKKLSQAGLFEKEKHIDYIGARMENAEVTVNSMIHLPTIEDNADNVIAASDHSMVTAELRLPSCGV